MGIAIITIPGKAQMAFANELHRRTGAVELIVIQKPRRLSPWARFVRLRRAVGWTGLLAALWHGLLLRLDQKSREALEYFRHADIPEEDGYLAPVMETESVNGDDVHARLSGLAPDLLVVWGSTILKPHIPATARRAINLHLGHCPYYRGALANHHAVLNGDRELIGATVHYINGKADAGDILAVERANVALPPSGIFRDLNTRARLTYLDIAARLHAGEDLPRTPQDGHRAHVLLLREWTPSLRYRLGRHMLDWEAGRV